MQLDLGCNFNSAETTNQGLVGTNMVCSYLVWGHGTYLALCQNLLPCGPGQCQNYYDSWARAVGGVGMKINKLSWGKIG